MKNETKNQQLTSAVKNNSTSDPKVFPKNNETITRYSDEELEEFRQLISDKLETSKSNYATLKETIMLKGDNGTNDTSPTFKLMEDAGDLWNKEEISEHAVRQLRYIEHLENALIRVKNKTYGICHLTGKLISKERLRSVPHSTLSIDAKLGNLNV